MREMPYHVLKDVIGHNYKLISKQGYQRFRRSTESKPVFTFKMDVLDSSQLGHTTTITKQIDIGAYSPLVLKTVANQAGINIDRAKQIDENWESKLAIQLFHQGIEPDLDLD